MRAIVTTTINPPTEALIRYSEMNGWRLVVAGDKKTPHEDYQNLFCEYLSPDWQLNYDVELSDAIGWNCIQRRNFAFLYAALEMQADIIATVDDDNIPLKGWGEDAALLESPSVMVQHRSLCEAFDPLYVTEHHNLWHRGFPLQLLSHRLVNSGVTELKPDIVANLWNGDPDIDAVCRMIFRPNVEFEDAGFPFCSDKPSPFNSQNTILSRKVMPHYFMLPWIDRMDDIWAAYHVQAQGFRVAYGKATVVQKRNEHNLTEDMKKEYIGYEKNGEIVRDWCSETVIKRLPPRSLEAFRLYQKHYE